MSKLIEGKQLELNTITPREVATGVVSSVGTANSAGTSVDELALKDHIHDISSAAQQALLQTKAITQPVQIGSFVADGTSDVVTTEVEGAATVTTEKNSPAGGKGILSTGTTPGDSASSATENYKLTLRDSSTKEAIDDGAGGEVYGVLEKTTTVWTLHYYKEAGGAHTIANTIDFIFAENTDLLGLNPLAFMLVNQFSEMIDSGASRTFKQEPVTTENITGSDTVLADGLDFAPVSNASVVLSLNGVQQEQGVAKDYTISGTAITWLASSGTAVDLATTDVLIATYVN